MMFFTKSILVNYKGWLFCKFYFNVMKCFLYIKHEKELCINNYFSLYYKAQNMIINKKINAIFNPKNNSILFN